jgi:hypothetical protein
MNLNNKKEDGKKDIFNKEKATAGRKPTTFNKLAEKHEFILKKRNGNVSIKLLQKVLEIDHGVLASESSLRKYCEKHVDTQAPNWLFITAPMTVIQAHGEASKKASSAKFEAKVLAKR